MRRAFTLIELMIVIAIIASIAAIAIPNMLEARDAKLGYRVGNQMRAKTSGVIVTILLPPSTDQLVLCRIDNGPNAQIRFVEVRFRKDELEPLLEAGRTPAKD